MFANPPNRTDYLTFLRNVAGIPVSALPDSSTQIDDTLSVAQDIVNMTIQEAAPTIYVLAVYNLATDRLLNYAIDQTGQTYFVDIRKAWNLLDITVGVISGGTDQGTTSAIENPEQLKMLTLADLQMLKTPYGRTYLGFAQSYGTNLWGLT